MNIKNDIINNSNLNAEEYIQKINTIKEKSNFILEEFKKLYVINKMHPESQEYKFQYENVVTNINTIQSNLFTTSNEIQINIDELNKKLIYLNTEIEKEKNNNKHLKRKLGIVENKNNSSYELINDYREIYNKYYLQNWSILLSTLLCIYTISVVYKN